MLRVYAASDPVDAALMRGWLESNGVRAVVLGDSLWGARGGLPFTADTGPSVWVADESTYHTARRLIDERERTISERTDAGESWECPNCGREIEEQSSDCRYCADNEEMS